MKADNDEFATAAVVDLRYRRPPVPCCSFHPLHAFQLLMRVAPELILGALIGVLLPASAARAEENAAAVHVGNGTPPSTTSQAAKGEHPFWDKENLLLFAAGGAGRTLDYLSTRNFRYRGVNEWLLTNKIVDNKPLFAGTEAAGLAVAMGVSYLFHRSGHHKLERWVSIVHIALGVGGSIRNYALKPPSPRAVR